MGVALLVPSTANRHGKQSRNSEETAIEFLSMGPIGWMLRSQLKEEEEEEEKIKSISKDEAVSEFSKPCESAVNRSIPRLAFSFSLLIPWKSTDFSSHLSQISPYIYAYIHARFNHGVTPTYALYHRQTSKRRCLGGTFVPKWGALICGRNMNSRLFMGLRKNNPKHFCNEGSTSR